MDSFKQEFLEFLRSTNSVSVALTPLKQGAVIKVSIDQKIAVIIEKTKNGIKVTDAKQEAPDIEFVLNFEAARHLLSQKHLPHSDFAVELLKQAGLGNLKFRLHCSTIKLMRMGFINVLTKIGKPFWSQFSQLGIDNPSKLLQVLNKIRTKN